MPFNLDDMLVVAITSRALFDLQESDGVFQEDGLDAYRTHQLEREEEPLNPGTAFPLVRGLLTINDRTGDQLVEVVIDPVAERRRLGAPADEFNRAPQAPDHAGCFSRRGGPVGVPSGFPLVQLAGDPTVY